MDTNIIQGNPTKSFFIEMITRDISIKDAILDLLDNSIDGANKINPTDYREFKVELTINENEFTIKDNCGGFSLEIAQKYAFRFGRPEDAPKTGGSVGRFGVGMKRALFKIGQNFEVESKSNGDHFQIKVDVRDWKNKKKQIEIHGEGLSEIDDWSFNYVIPSENESNLVENGTVIKVVNLNPDVSASFGSNSFLNDLEDDIERLLNFSIEKGLIIILNGKTLQKKGIVIFNEHSRPYYFETAFNNVKVRIIAGLSYVGEPHTSGWYIYCNDRLVLEADRTAISGWGISSIPKWHVDFVMFKGLVFMDSDETINLPLTTTKKGIDATSIIYRKTLFYMIEAMNSVLNFLKNVRKLGNDANDYRKLLSDQEDKVSVTELKTKSFVSTRKFISPTIDVELIATKKEFIRIAFNAPRKLAENARYHSGSKNFTEFGNYIFNYYINMEELSNE